MKNVFFILVTSSCFLFSINLKNQSKNQFVVAQEVTGIHFNGCNGENPQATGLAKAAFMYGKAALEMAVRHWEDLSILLGATEGEETRIVMNHETEQKILLKQLN
jgi:hypothetical protein